MKRHTYPIGARIKHHVVLKVNLTPNGEWSFPATYSTISTVINSNVYVTVGQRRGRKWAGGSETRPRFHSTHYRQGPVVVRSRHKLSAEILNNPNATVIEASVLDLTDEEMVNHVKNCAAVVSCLGHVMDFKGMLENPKSSAQMRRGVCATRSNVVRFMTELVENAELWNAWKFRMPVIMNSDP